MRRCATVLLSTLAAAVIGATSANASTLERTLRPVGSGASFRLEKGAGEPHLPRSAPGTRPSEARAGRRRSLAFFAHLTDLHIADEASPARFEYLSGLSRAFGALWRPQEAFGPHVADRAVRAINEHRISPVVSAGGPARMGFALVTGDMADNAQVNEVRWAVRVLSGGLVDPFSGRRVSRNDPCGKRAAVRLRLARDVARRRYAGSPQSREALAAWPGVLDRAQRRFWAEGLEVPWYSARGNHDALAQGHYGPATARPRSAPTGCRKLFTRGASAPEAARNPWSLLGRGRASGRAVAPDPRRRFLRSAAEFRRLHGRADDGHGFGLTPRGELTRSRGAALYYAWSPRPGLRFIALDTTADGGGPGGNVDHPQYLWLSRELRRAQRRRQLVAVYAHHPLELMNNRRHDELAGRFDRDPRDSRPLHLGRRGVASLRSLLLRHSNVVLYLTGHKHYDRIWPNFRARGRGFWQVITGTLAGAPQQARLIELMDNRDGTLSIFTTMVDHSASAVAPAAGDAEAFSPADLASISRTIAWSGRLERRGSRATSSPGMRNVELILRDPRRGRR